MSRFQITTPRISNLFLKTEATHGTEVNITSHLTFENETFLLIKSRRGKSGGKVGSDFYVKL